MFGLFHKGSEKPLSEKGLLGVLDYSAKSSRDVAQLADDNRVSANNLMTYGSLLGDDLTDVTHKLGLLLIQWSNILMEFQDSIDQYRDTLKSISIKEASLQPSRDQKRKLKDNIERLQGSLSSLDKLNNLKEQFEQLEEFTEPDEVEMNNFKRIATREGLYLLLNGMHAMASKTDIVSTFGKYVVDELDVNPVKPGEERQSYTAMDKTKRIVDDAKKAIDQWNPDKTKVRRTLTSHLGRNPLIVKQLPPVPQPSSSNLTSEKTSPTPSSTTSTSSLSKKTTTAGEEDEEDVVVPNRTISLEEQNKQYSFYKPDEVGITLEEQEQEAEHQQASPVAYQPQLNPSPSTSSNTVHGGGFSNMYLHSPHLLPQPGLINNQQNLYQFYQHYLPPRSYEEMTTTFSSGAVFRTSAEENKKIRRRWIRVTFNESQLLTTETFYLNDIATFRDEQCPIQ